MPMAPQLVLATVIVALLAGAIYAQGAPAQSSPTYISAIQVDPTRPNVVFAGTIDHGVLKSTDGGRTWGAANRGLPRSPWPPPASGIRVDALVIDPRSPNVLYAGTGLGVFKTSDGARTWRLAGTGIDYDDDSRKYRLAEGSIWGMAIDPIHTSTVYAAGRGGAWKTTTGGATWKRVLRNRVLNLAVDPRRPNTVYANGMSFYKTVDGGGRWRQSEPPGLHDNFFGHSIVVDRYRPGMIYAGGSRGLFASSNQGRTWSTVLPLPRASSGVNAIALDPSRANVLYVGTFTRGIVKSVDAGQTWSTLHLGGHGCGVSAIAIARTRPQTIYAGVYGERPAAGGMFVSTDGGARWRRLF